MNYETTKQFTDWLKEVKPDFEIQSEWVMYQGKDLTYSVQIDCDTEYYISDLGTLNSLGRNKNMIAQTIAEDWCYEISTDLLHNILWELFDVENEMYSIKEEIVYEGTFDLEHGNKKAFQKWIEYTSGKGSLWKTNPDKVLKDIIKTYKELK